VWWSVWLLSLLAHMSLHTFHWDSEVAVESLATVSSAEIIPLIATVLVILLETAERHREGVATHPLSIPHSMSSLQGVEWSLKSV